MVGFVPGSLIRPLQGNDPVLAFRRGAPGDLLIGGAWWTYATETRVPESNLGRSPGLDAWVVWDAKPVGLWVENTLSDQIPAGKSPWSLGFMAEWKGRLGWESPRQNRALLTAAAYHFEQNGAAGYGDIVRWVSLARSEDHALRNAPPPATWGDSVAMVGSDRFHFVEWPECPPLVQGAGLTPTARQFPQLQDVLKKLGALVPQEFVQTYKIGPFHRLTQNAQGLSLLADLLHSTLIVPQREFYQAWDVIRDSRLPSETERTLAEYKIVEPPPWPPASVDLLKSRPRANVLLKSLIEHISSSSATREWLTSQFEANPGYVNAKLLVEMGSVLGVEQASESRLRSWLSAEWSAWAGQRYRRAARLAAEKGFTS